ncbi:AI-2E family transporter [Oricola sp.]|uniref:AI-2E family transporter n=1 Tax=Oricola sp. TaxID=1979950 RepID=UPI0025EDF20F|nr:AI-2E family transporter [Oricola sp.]MCI5074846.1 AI-2E family transporter [Oricola sp.]
MIAFDSLLFRSLATLSLLIAIVAALFFAKAVFLPIALGLLAALVLHLPIMALYRAGLPKILAVALIISAAGGLLGLIFVLTAGPISETFEAYPQIVSELRVKLFHLRETFAAAEQASDAISKVADEVKNIVEDSEVPEVVVREPNFIARAATSLADIATGIVVTLTISAFILVMRRPFLTLATMPFATTESKLRAARIWKAVEREVSHYFVVASIINATLGVAVGLALWALGVPLPHVWGIAVALLNFILFVGPAVGTMALLAASIITFDTGFEIFAPALAYLAINFIEANVVTPHFLGRRLNLAPLAIVLSLLFWGWLWGLAGLIIAVPTLIVLKAVAERSVSLSAVRRLLTPRRRPGEAMEPIASARVGSPERRPT